MNQIKCGITSPVLTLNKDLTQEIPMPQSYTIIYDDDETQPDLIVKAAALHGIEPELLIKRFITQGLKPYRQPMKDISEFDSLDEFFKGNGLKK